MVLPIPYQMTRTSHIVVIETAGQGWMPAGDAFQVLYLGGLVNECAGNMPVRSIDEPDSRGLPQTVQAGAA